MPPAIEFIGLTKKFGTLLANDNVSFAIRAGTIHGIVGENGAGKSTLMSALFGLYKPDAGEIRLNGKQVSIKSPSAAIARIVN
ncbi:ATP-binding cassette domain-containing protein, partial [Mesorhizobium sp. M7A.F.Ca.US.008.03.1.1]|uniref:ATP-binding cassette domain-containing protein n=1 Tax=Mesorhizobium sp. M7A.F.Ca.US.008.03.1.1 TaxID=2496742 RepID=UPI0013DFF11A